MAEKRPEWKDSKYADAKGKFKDLSCGDLADWLIKSRKGNKKAIVGSLNQQIVFNRKKNPTYAKNCLLYTSPSPRDLSTSRMPSSA